MEEQCSKIISLPDMTVAFAALSTLFGNHAVLAKQDVDEEEYDHQFKKFLCALDRLHTETAISKVYDELSSMFPPIFTYFYLHLILNGHISAGTAFYDIYAPLLKCYDANLTTVLSAIKTEEQVRKSKEVNQLLSHRVRISLSPESTEWLIKLLEANKLWLVYAAINAQVFVEQTTLHEVDPIKSNESYYQGQKEDPPEGSNKTLSNGSASAVSDFEAAAAGVRKMPPSAPPIRLLTFSDDFNSTPTAAQFSQSGEYCAFARSDHRVSLMPVVQKTGSTAKNDFKTLNSSVTRLAFANEDQLLFAASGCEVIYWKLKDSQTKVASRLTAPSLNSLQPVWTICVSPLDLFLANGCHDSTTNLFDLSNLNSASSLVRVFVDLSPNSVTAPVSAIAFHPNCAYLASGYSNGSIVMWDISDAAPVRRFTPSPLSPIATLQFTPDGSRLLSLDDAGTLLVFDLRMGLVTPTSSFSTGIIRPAPCLPVSHDSSLVCVGGANKLTVLPMLSTYSSPELPTKLPRLNVLDADFRTGNILHVLCYKSSQ